MVKWYVEIRFIDRLELKGTILQLRTLRNLDDDKKHLQAAES